MRREISFALSSRKTCRFLTTYRQNTLRRPWRYSRQRDVDLLREVQSEQYLSSLESRTSRQKFFLEVKINLIMRAPQSKRFESSRHKFSICSSTRSSEG